MAMTEKVLAKEIAEQLKKVLRDTGKTSQNSARGGSSDSPKRDNNKKIPELDIVLTNKNFKSLAKSTNAVLKEIENFDKGLRTSDRTINELIGTQSHFIKSMLQHDNMTNDASDKLMLKLNEQLVGYSFMGKSMKEYTGKLKDMMELFDESGEFLSDYNKTLEDLNETSLDTINDKKKMKKALRAMAKDDKLSASIRQKLDKAAQSGDIDKMKIAGRLVTDEVKNAKKLRGSIQNSIIGFEKHNAVITGSKEVLSKFSDSIGLGFIGQMTTVIGAIGLLGVGIKGLYNQFTGFSKAGFGTGGAFTTAIKGMFTLGVSQDAYTQNLSSNANTVAQIGMKGFTDMISNAQMALMNLGQDTETSIKSIALFAESAKSAGMNLGSKELTDSIKKQTSAYSTLFAITGITSEQFARENESLLESNDFRTQMGRLNKQERVNVLNGIMAERERLTTMGLSNQQSLEFIRATQGALNSNVSDRFDQSAQLVQAMSALGLGSQAGDARNILLKGNRASENEKSKLKDYLIAIRSRAESTAGGSLQQESIAQSLTNFGGALGQAYEKTADVQVSEAKKISEGQKKQRMDQLKRSKIWSSIDKGISQLGNVITSPLFVIAASTVAILFMMRKNGGLIKGLRSILGKGGGEFRGPARPGRLTMAARRIKSGIGSIGSGIGNTIKSRIPNVVAKGAGIVSAIKSKIPTVLAKGTTKLGSVIPGILKGAGKMSGALKIASGAAKFLGPLGLIVTAGFAIADGISAYGRAAEIFGKKTATTQEKISASIGGAISSLTFGLLPEEGTAKFINSAVDKAKEFSSFAVDKIKAGFTWYGKMLMKIAGAVKDFAVNAWEGLKSAGNSVLGFFGIGDSKAVVTPSTPNKTPSQQIRIKEIQKRAKINTVNSNVENITNEVLAETEKTSIISTEKPVLMDDILAKLQELVDIAVEERDMSIQKNKTEKFSALRNIPTNAIDALG